MKSRLLFGKAFSATLAALSASCMSLFASVPAVDTDGDGIYDGIDPNPTTPDVIQIISGSDYTMRILGSGRVVELQIPAGEINDWLDGNPDVARVSKRVYEQFSDAFDFIFFVSNATSLRPNVPYVARAHNFRNDASGIGMPLSDFGQMAGSAGRLRSAVHLLELDQLREGPSLHELAHTWGIVHPALPGTQGHPGFTSSGGTLGGWQAGTLEDLGGGRYRAQGPLGGSFSYIGSNYVSYSPMELYFMGLIGPDELPDIQVADNAVFTNAANGEFTASAIRTVTAADFEAAGGVRTPSAAYSTKAFRGLTVVLTETPIAPAVWAQMDRDVYDFATPGSNGIGQKNFWEATGGRATLTMGDAFHDLKSQPRPTLAGPATVAAAGQGTYTITGVPGLADYEVEATRFAPDTVLHGAEPGETGVRIRTFGAYPALTTELAKSGTSSYHLRHYGAQNESIEFTQRFKLTTDSVLTYWARTEHARAEENYKVQISEDDGETWTTIYDQNAFFFFSGFNGASLLGGNFLRHECPLADHAGKEVVLRFAMECSDFLASPPGLGPNGFYFDDVEISNTMQSVESTVIPATGLSAAFSPVLGGEYTLRARAVSGAGHPLLWGAHIPVAVPGAPSIQTIAVQTMAEDATLTIPFRIVDTEFVKAHTVSALADNSTLFPAGSITFSGTGKDRTMTLRPAANESGSALITLTVTDPGGLSGTLSFTTTVTPVNDAPSSAAQTFLNLHINESGSVPFAIGDIDSPLENLTVTLDWPRNSAFPEGSLSLSGTGANRTLNVMPASNTTGSTVAVLTVSDGVASSTRNVSLVVRPAFNPPTINVQSAVSLPEDFAPTFTFTVNDFETPNQLTLSATSSNAALAPDSLFQYSGSGNSLKVKVFPTANMTGTTRLTVTVTDPDGMTATSAFDFTVYPVNDAPTIDLPAHQTLPEDFSPQSLSLTGISSGAPNENQTLMVTASSSNTALIPTPTVRYTSPASTAVLNFAPVPDASGTANITVTVSDGSLSTQRTFAVNVTPQTEAPTIAAIAPVSVDEDGSTTFAVTVGDPDTPPGDLVLSVLSDNTLILPPSAFTFGGSGAARTVTVHPVENAAGSSVVHVFVSDGENSASAVTTVTIRSINDAPELSVAATATTDEDTPLDITVSIADVETPEQVTLSAASSDETLVPAGGMTFSGSGFVRTLHISPTSRKNGTANITVTAHDPGGATAQKIIALTVNSVNSAPLIAPISAKTTPDNTALDIAVNLDDDDDPASLTVSAQSDSPSLLPPSAFTWSGTGAQRTLRVTPSIAVTGTAQITVTATDPADRHGSATFAFTVTASGNRPTIGAPSSVGRVVKALITPGGIATSVRVEYGATTAYGSSRSIAGSFTTESEASVELTDLDANTDYHFRFVAENSYGVTTGTDAIVRYALNRAPTAAADDFRVTSAGALLDVLANDDDEDGDEISIASFTAPGHGTVRQKGTQLFYKPDATFKGNDQFDYTISDGHGSTATGTVSIGKTAALAGSVRDFIRDDSGALCGTVKLDIAAGGTFTGSVQWGGKPRPFGGQLSPEGKASVALTGKGLPSWQLALTAATTGDGSVRYQLAFLDGNAAAHADTTVSAKIADAPPFAGSYTLVTDSAEGGSGWAAVIVGKSGNATAKGRTGDGTPFSAGGMLVEGGGFPLWASLYKSPRGAVGGLVMLPETAAATTTTLGWFKPEQLPPVAGQAGFAHEISTRIARWAKPTAGQTVVPSGASITIDGIGLASPITTPLTFRADGKLLAPVSSPAGFKIAINPASGLFSGKFTHPLTRKKASFAGAIIQPTLESRGTATSAKILGSVALDFPE